MSDAKERPIILTAQEVNAALAGDKTQYRVQALTPEQIADGYKWCYGIVRSEVIFCKYEDSYFTKENSVIIKCPFGVIGDRLWVQEFHARTDRNMHFTEPHYYADGPLTLDLRHDAGLLIKYSAADMPRWASRILLEITDIRIERLNDISEQDAIAEGIKYIHADPKDRSGPNHFTKSNGWYHCSHPTAAEVFKEMYTVSDDYEKYGDNPWVWVIEFKVIKLSEVQGG